MTTRTQDEIVARIAEAEKDDFLGFRREVLIESLDFEHAKPFLQEGVTADQWHPLLNPTELTQHAAEYYGFALGKIRDHRSISAGRSVDKLGEYAWLLGKDDVLAAMEAADYAQYGASKVKAFGAGLDLAWPADEAMNRMASGQPCTPDCREGCGR